MNRNAVPMLGASPGAFSPGLRAAAPLCAIFLSWAAIGCGSACAADPVAFGAGTTSAQTRFGAALGAGSQWQSSLNSAGPNAAVTFGGGMRLSCTGVDFNGFLRSFDPAELLSEMRNSLLTGAQAAAANYLITLAYANPTISSVLDMMDKRYSARFGAFAQACNAQADRARGQDAGARAMADSGDQCFGQEVARGTAPTEAYRRCSVLHVFDGLDIPAAASVADFLRKYTSLNVTKEFETLLGLLPDERVSQGNYQYRPPRTTVAALAGRLRDQTRAALDRLDAGEQASSIPACGPDVLAGTAASGAGCLPSSSLALVNSPAFRPSRLLEPAARSLFKDAFSTQLAVEEIYSQLVDLYDQTARIDVRADGTADAAHASSRKRQIQAAIGELLQQVDTQVKAQEARARIVRSQMLSLEQVQAALDARHAAVEAQGQKPRFSLRDLVRLFSDRSN